MKMEKPTVEAVRFGSRDVIATSGQLGVQIGGLYNGKPGDWFVSNLKGATSGTQDFSTIADYFNEARGLTGYSADTVGYENFSTHNGSHMVGLALFGQYEEDSRYDYLKDFNGWYIWYSTSSGGGYFGRTS